MLEKKWLIKKMNAHTSNKKMNAYAKLNLVGRSPDYQKEREAFIFLASSSIHREYRHQQGDTERPHLLRPRPDPPRRAPAVRVVAV